MRERMALDEWRKRKLVDLDVPPFLASFWRMYPQHFALIYMMLVTGLRPSSLRPLRRRGPHCDVLWEEGVLLVRRSHT